MHPTVDAHHGPILRRMFNASFVPTALVAADGKFLACNPAYCSLLEYSELELLRRDYQSLTDPDDVEADVSNAQKVSGGEIESYEILKGYLSKSKRLIRVRLRVDAVRDDAGEFVCFLAQVAPVGSAAPPTALTAGAGLRALVWMRANGSLIFWLAAGLAAFLGYLLKERKP